MLQGKRGVVLGVANKRSLAWGIAKTCAGLGAELAVTVQSDRFLESARSLTKGLPALTEGLPGEREVPVLLVDVTDEDTVSAAAQALSERWGRLDFLVHSIAFANPAELKGLFRDTTKDGFGTALEISAYSLISVSRAFAPLMTEGGSIVALSYLGGERVVPNYNVMGVAKAALDSAVRYLAYDLGSAGIRVNSAAPGPIRTLSASGIGDFGKMLDHARHSAPLRRNVTAEDVGGAVAFLVSDLASGVTGVHIPVDCGYSIMGVARGVPDAEEADA